MKHPLILFACIFLILALTAVSGLWAIIEPTFLFFAMEEAIPLRISEGSLGCPVSLEAGRTENICLRIIGPINFQDTLATELITQSDDGQGYDYHSLNISPTIQEITPQTEDFFTCWKVDTNALLDRGFKKGSTLIFRVFIKFPQQVYSSHAECSIYIDQPLLGFITKRFQNFVAWFLVIANVLACLALFKTSELKSGQLFWKWMCENILLSILLAVLFWGILLVILALMGPFVAKPQNGHILRVGGWIGLILASFISCRLAIPAVNNFVSKQKASRSEQNDIDTHPGNS